jgi:hypothetical protein
MLKVVKFHKLIKNSLLNTLTYIGMIQAKNTSTLLTKTKIRRLQILDLLMYLQNK